MTYSVYYTYDQSQRLTTQWTDASAPTLEAHYFSYNQRNKITKIQDQKATGADALRTFTYNGWGERVFGVDSNSTTTPSYWSYDRGKLLREKIPGVATTHYRHNDTCQDWLGSLFEFVPSDGSSHAYPVFDKDGSMKQLVGVGGPPTSIFDYNRFMETLVASDLIGGSPPNRLRADTKEMTHLTTPSQDTSLIGGRGAFPKEAATTTGPNQSLTFGFGSQLLYNAPVSPLYDEAPVGSDTNAQKVPPAGGAGGLGGDTAGVGTGGTTAGVGSGTGAGGTGTDVAPGGSGGTTTGPKAKDDICNKPPESACCGPEATDWFAVELQMWIQFALDVDKNVVATFLPTTEGNMQGPLQLKKLGPTPTHRASTFNSAGGFCPSADCGSTVTICKSCLANGELGNMIYGAMAAYLVGDWFTARVGISFAAWTEGHLAHDESIDSAHLGFDFVNNMPKKYKPGAVDAATLCAALTGEHWTGAKKEHLGCSPCTRSTIPAGSFHTTFPTVTTAGYTGLPSVPTTITGQP